jgi:hypothetical protein
MANANQMNPLSLTSEQLTFLDEERKKHFSGEGKSYSWDEVKEMIRQKKVSNDAAQEWDLLTPAQQEKIKAGIEQANTDNTKPVAEIIAMLRQKYGLNSQEN